MNYFDRLSNTSIPIEDRFDLWDFRDLSYEQYCILKYHPQDNFSLNLSTLPETMYAASWVKLHPVEAVTLIDENFKILLRPISQDQWNSEVVPLINKIIFNRQTLKCPPLEPLDTLSTSPPPTPTVNSTKNNAHAIRTSARSYKYIISKTLLIKYFANENLWEKMPNDKYCFSFALVPPKIDLFIVPHTMGYNPTFPDPISFQNYKITRKNLFSRPQICRLYIMDKTNEFVLCPMCSEMVCDFYHECIKTGSGNDMLFNLLLNKRPTFYLVCHRFEFKFHSIECLIHLNQYCKDKYKIFNNILYKKINNSNYLAFSSMLNIKEYVLPSKILLDKCYHE